MEAPSKLQENRIGDDFVLRFGNFAIDLQRGSRALLLPAHAARKETSPEPRSAFSFPDVPSSPEPSSRDPAPVGNLNTEARGSHVQPKETFCESNCWDPSTVGNLSADARDSQATPEKSVFAFLDSPRFQESNEPAAAATAPLYPNELWGPTDNVYLNEALPGIFQLMTDQPKRFENLLESCSAPHLYVILERFWSEKDSFLRAALIENGSRSIQSFIQKLEGTGLEGYFTFIIHETASNFMSSKHAWHVVEACFKTFANPTNENLYIWVLQRFQQLSMLQYGCLTIIAMMDTVGRDLLSELLKLVLKNVCQLAIDPWGNHVVQHCLSELRNEDVNHRICRALKGGFVELAQKRFGSYVVQNCIRCSNDAGRGLVLGDIFKDDSTLLMLAKNSFGNYPVQMALMVTWIRDRPMYDKLVRVLQPQFTWLIQRAHGEMHKLLASTRQQQGKPQTDFQSSKKTSKNRPECLPLYT